MTKAAGLLALLVIASIGVFASAKAQENHVSARAVATVALFNQFCLDAPPDANEINSRASRAGWKVLLDRPIPNGRQKEWLVPDAAEATTPLVLSLEGGVSRDQSKIVTVCGVIATNASGADLAAELSSDPRLGPPVDQRDAAPSGGTTVYWLPKFNTASSGSVARLLLFYDIPGSQANLINLLYIQHRPS